MSNIPVLYHAERSSNSQRCRMALAERGIEYKSIPLSLFGDQHDPHFLRVINPLGLVPVMVHNGEYIRDSKDILDYVDELPSDKPKLNWEDDPEKAARVCYFIDVISKPSFRTLTYGSILNRQHSKNCMAPEVMTWEDVTAANLARIHRLKKFAVDNPDLAETAEMIRKRSVKKCQGLDNEEALLKTLDDYDKIFDEIEKELERQRKSAGTSEYWLCGGRFSMADIFLTVVLFRAYFVGHSERFFLGKRPLLTDYFQRVTARQSFIDKISHAVAAKYWASPQLLNIGK